jgi:hypothetical protein
MPKLPQRLALETVELEAHDSHALCMRGVMAMREPSTEVGPWLRRLHEGVAAAGVSDFTVDVTALSFMNSSSIRVFIDWVEWIRKDGAGYVLTFRIDPGITWQKSTFGALRTLDSQRVRVVAQA